MCPVNSMIGSFQCQNVGSGLKKGLEAAKKGLEDGNRSKERPGRPASVHQVDLGKFWDSMFIDMTFFHDFLDIYFE